MKTASLQLELSVSDTFERYAAVWDGVPEATVYHHPGWRRAFSVYGLQTHWLVAEAEGTVQGVLPLVRQSSRLFGRRLASLPWVDQGGAIGSQQAITSLLAHASQLTDNYRDHSSLVLKQSPQTNASPLSAQWSSQSGDKVLMRRQLAISADELWSDLSAKVRNQIRKAEKNGLSTSCGGVELLADFYQIYSQNMRDLGSPSHSLAFFQALVEGLEELASVYVTSREESPIGAGLVLQNGLTWEIPWASSLREFNHYCINHQLYWTILAAACEQGCQWFHFGRSTVDSGQHRFKKQWGAEELPLNWLIYSQEAIASRADNPADIQKSYGLAQRVWSRLPLWATRRLGPLLIRQVP